MRKVLSGGTVADVEVFYRGHDRQGRTVHYAAEEAGFRGVLAQLLPDAYLTIHSHDPLLLIPGNLRESGETLEKH